METMVKGLRLILVAGLFCFMLSGFSVAEEKKEKKKVELEEEVITATKTKKLLKDVPIRTEVITAADIEASGAVNLYEALEGMMGVRIEQQCSYCNFSIVRMQGLEAGHVQVLIDGQPIYSGLAGVYGLQQVPTGNIERIEIVKGAGSALYGSSAIAGVINIITKKPTKEPMVEVTTSLGTDHTNSYTLAASTRATNMDVMITAQKNTMGAIDEDDDSDKDDLPERYTDRVKTDNIAKGVRINWYDVFGGDDQLTFTGRTINESRAGGNLTNSAWRNPFSASAENIDTTRYETGLGYKKKFLNGNTIAANFAYCIHHRDATNDTFLGDYETCFGGPPPVDIMEPYCSKEKLYVLDLNYSHLLQEKHHLLGGIQYSRNELKETGKYLVVDDTDPAFGTAGYSSTAPYRSKSKKEANEIGLYLQDEFSVTDEIELVFGVRYDTHSSKDDFGVVDLDYEEKAFNPRFAVLYRALPELTLRSSVGTGFRVPYGFSEDLHLCSGSPRVNKPASLDPEKSVSINLGGDYVAERYTLSANIFRTNLKDKIGFVDASPATAVLGYDYEWKNISDAYTQGIELGSTILVTPELDLNLNLSYTDAQYDKNREDWVNHPVHGNRYASDSKYIPRVPEITSGVKLDYGLEDWNFIWQWNYTGKMYIDYNANDDVADPASKIKHTGGFAVTNIRVSRSFPKAGMSLFVGVKNLFDKVQGEKHHDDAAFMYAPYTGRTIYAGTEVKF